MSESRTTYDDPLREMSAEQIKEKIEEHTMAIDKLSAELARRCEFVVMSGSGGVKSEGSAI